MAGRSAAVWRAAPRLWRAAPRPWWAAPRPWLPSSAQQPAFAAWHTRIQRVNLHVSSARNLCVLYVHYLRAHVASTHKYTTRQPHPTLNSTPIEVTSQGQVKKLKSFLRWCYNGPPLARADSVSVSWEDM